MLIWITTTTTIYFNKVVFPVYWSQPRLWHSHNIFLHLDLSQASSLQNPFSLMSFLNTSLQLFLSLPFTPLPSTCSVSILFTKHNSSLSTWPNHLSLFCHMTSVVINCQHAPHLLIAFLSSYNSGGFVYFDLLFFILVSICRQKLFIIFFCTVALFICKMSFEI